MTTPTIHLNGTSRESLLDGYRNAADALRGAIAALQQTAPHGRDYYPQGDNVLYVATDEHYARLEKLQQVLNEINELALAVCKTH
jgi:hypothetical protein